jgi:hypothetical protein
MKAQPPPPKTRYAMGIFIAVITAVCTAAAVLAFQKVIEYWQRPILKFETGAQEPFVRIVSRSVGNELWIRVRLQNSGWSEAQSDRVYLTDLTKNGTAEPMFKDDAVLLYASSGGDGNRTAPLTISPNFGRFFDLAASIGTDHFKIPNTEYYDLEGYGPGTYRFRIAASGANFRPVVAVVEVGFEGASKPVKVSLISTGK